MKFDLSATVGDYTLQEIRGFLRTGLQYHAARAAHHFDISLTKARALMRQLVEAGYLEPEKDLARLGGRDKWFECTTLGVGLRTAKAWKRVPREQVRPILDKLVEAAIAINACDDYIFLVEEIRLFGSAIEQTPDVGDIDIAVKLQPRPKYCPDFTKASIERARAAGLRGRNFVELVVYGQTEVKRQLRKASRYISMHDLDELEMLKIPSERLFSTTLGSSRGSA